MAIIFSQSFPSLAINYVQTNRVSYVMLQSSHSRVENMVSWTEWIKVLQLL